jgi:23S rRNA pseudouridine1911/1915/1917 synthase
LKTTGTNPDIEILFEDNHLIAVNKPAGVLAQEDHTGKPDILTLCKEYIKREYNKPGNVFLGLLHRLDRPVSGVMVLAKTSKAASRISEQIRKRSVRKTYLAVVEGSAPNNGYLRHYLMKDKQSNITRAVPKGTPQAKESTLTFETLDRAGENSLVKVNLITGRAHQIRVQFAEAGNPIWGDRKYGNRGSSGDIALHAYEFELEHPTLKKTQSFRTSPENKTPWSSFKSLFGS